jgi:EamA-like transporter family
MLTFFESNSSPSLGNGPSLGTGLAYANWFRGIQLLLLSVLSILGLLSPLVATIAGWRLLDQTLSLPQLLRASLMLIAVTCSLRTAAARVTLIVRTASRRSSLVSLDAIRKFHCGSTSPMGR